MLQAINEEGRSVTLAMLPKEQLAELKKAMQIYYCPTCGEPVIPKAGTKVIPHFAHRTKLDCPSGEGGEGAYHEKGKLQMHQWLKLQGLKTELEFFHREIRQRSDILITLNGKVIAIEFQCATIPDEEIDKRTEGYRQAGITPIWIAGARHFVRYRQSVFRLDAFLKKLLHRFSENTPLTLYFYCPDTGNLIIIQHIRIIKGNRAAGKIRILPLRKLGFPVLFRTLPYAKDIGNAWLKEKRDFRTRPPGRKYGTEFSWWHWLYGKGLHPQTLPSEIFLPVESQLLMKTSIWDWQSRLCIDILHPLQIGQTFNVARCERMLASHFHRATSYPLAGNLPSPIVQYLDLLQILGFLKCLPEGTYEKTASFHFPRNVEEGLLSDEHTLQKIFSRPEP